MDSDPSHEPHTSAAVPSLHSHAAYWESLYSGARAQLIALHAAAGWAEARLECGCDARTVLDELLARLATAGHDGPRPVIDARDLVDSEQTCWVCLVVEPEPGLGGETLARFGPGWAHVECAARERDRYLADAGEDPRLWG